MIEFETVFFGIPIVFPLKHTVFYTLTGQLIFEFTGDDRQTVDKNTKIQSQFSIVVGISNLPGNAENILSKEFRSPFVLFRRSHIEHYQRSRVNGNTFAQHINNTAFSYLALQAVKKLLALDFAGVYL